MGIEQNKLSKVLAGTRRIQAEEVPAILEFFGLALDGSATRPIVPASPSGFSESEAEIYEPSVTGRAVIDALADLGTRPRHRQGYRLRRDFMGFGYLRGDVLMIDMGAEPQYGDMVIATLSDPTTDAHSTVVRRYLGDWLAEDSPAAPLLKVADDQTFGILGVVRGSFRR